MDAELEDSDNLDRFFQVLAKFNKDKPLKSERKKRITKSFDYKWGHDRNMAIEKAEEVILE